MLFVNHHFSELEPAAAAAAAAKRVMGLLWGRWQSCLGICQPETHQHTRYSQNGTTFQGIKYGYFYIYRVWWVAAFYAAIKPCWFTPYYYKIFFFQYSYRPKLACRELVRTTCSQNGTILRSFSIPLAWFPHSFARPPTKAPKGKMQLLHLLQ